MSRLGLGLTKRYDEFHLQLGVCHGGSNTFMVDSSLNLPFGNNKHVMDWKHLAPL